MTTDYHIHSTYSDGSLLVRMLEAASDVTLDGVGIADHCIISDRDPQQQRRARLGFNLDRTHDRRRAAIEWFRTEYDLSIYDALELDYAPADEADIKEFLRSTDFDYAIGSVHAIDGIDVQDTPTLEALSEAAKTELVDSYFEVLVALIESELFAVAAHPDLIERTAPLRGRATTDHYERVATAFQCSRTIPEINAGRVNREFGRVHPTEEFLSILQAHDLEFCIGSDAHRPQELRDRNPHIQSVLEDQGITPVAPEPVRSK